MGLKFSAPGSTSSLPSTPLLEKLKKWEWRDIHNLQLSYSDNVYGFGLNRETVMQITKLSEIEVEELFHLLDSHDFDVINAITMFISFYLLGNCESFHLVVESIFDLLDFYSEKELDRNELTILMFCIARALSSILSQPNTCPTDTAMHALVGKFIDSMGKKGKSSLTREEFCDVLTSMVNKIHPKTLESIYTNYFQSNEEVSPETNSDDVSLPSIPLLHPQHQQLLVEPFEPTNIPDKKSDEQSNLVLSMLDPEDGQADLDLIQDDNSLHSTGSRNSISNQSTSSLGPKKISSSINEVPNSVSSRPSSASSLREKSLVVLPPISVHSPRQNTSLSNQSPRSVEIIEKPTDSREVTSPSSRENPNHDPMVVEAKSPHGAAEAKSPHWAVEAKSPHWAAEAKSPHGSPHGAVEAKSPHGSPHGAVEAKSPHGSPHGAVEADDSKVDKVDEDSNLISEIKEDDSPQSITSDQTQTLAPSTAEKSPFSIAEYLQQTPITSQNAVPIDAAYEGGFIEFSQISVCKLTHPDRGDVYPFVEIKLVAAAGADGASEVQWSHRTELSLDSDDDALWYTHFRSPYSSSDCQQNILRIDVYFMEKVSPRLSSVDDSVIREKKIHVGGAIISDSRTIFKKQMKWIQLIGILSSSDSSTGTMSGMYTITTRYNPNTESSPRSQFSHTIVKDKVHEYEGQHSVENHHDGGTTEAWPGEYEYDSYYHEGGYYDHYTHAYLGNAYDHATGQYYHDENIVYDGNTQQYHDQSTSYEHHESAENLSEQYEGALPLNNAQDATSETPYWPGHYEEVVPNENHPEEEEYSLDLQFNTTNIVSPNPNPQPVEQDNALVDSSPQELPSNEPTPLVPNDQPASVSEQSPLEPMEEQQEEVGFFEIQDITLSKLKKSDGFFSSSRVDPFVSLSIGNPPIWSYTTDVQSDKAALADWIINTSVDIPQNLLTSHELSLTVQDQAKKRIIGKATISLRSLPSKGSNWTAYEGILKENDKTSGDYRVRMRYRYQMMMKKK